MNNNKKKYVVLAVVGAVIMVVFIFGTSYAALFNYENVPVADPKTNDQNIFTVEGEQEITINNKYPISYSEIDNNDNLTTMQITIMGHNNYKQGYNFALYLVKGDNENPIDDSVIYAQIVYPTVAPGYAITDYGVNEEKTFGRIDSGAPLTGLNSGKEIKLLSGNIHTLAEDGKQSFEIKFWLDSSKVIVSDTINRDSNNRAIDCDMTDLGKVVYRTEEFQELTSNIKLKVVSE